jgi:hypothetical protein
LSSIDQPPNLVVSRRQSDGSWAPSSIAEFVAADDPATPTSFVVHGNQVDSSLAVAQGLRVYRQLVVGIPEAQRVRFVIWSWPSERIHGIVKDVRLKAARTTTDSKYLAWTLQQLNPHTPIRLVGFSFGARIATGALHLLGGGELNGFSLPPETAPQLRSVRVVLVAAALRNSWLAEGNYHGRTLDVVESMLLINNSCDAALKRYHVAEACRDAEALGYTGPAGRLPHANKIQQVDACCDLGKSHNWELYIASPRYAALMRQYAWPPVAARQTQTQVTHRAAPTAATAVAPR